MLKAKIKCLSAGEVSRPALQMAVFSLWCFLYVFHRCSLSHWDCLLFIINSLMNFLSLQTLKIKFRFYQIPSFLSFSFSSSFSFCCACSMWEFPVQELDPHHSWDLCHSCCNARFLTCCSTRELTQIIFCIYLHDQHFFSSYYIDMVKKLILNVKLPLHF